MATRIGLDFELEAEFDAQAFATPGPRAKRALIVSIEDGDRFVLSKAVPWDTEKSVRLAFDADVRPLLAEAKPRFVLFRTETWAMMTWAPKAARESDLYLEAADELHSALGGGGGLQMAHHIIPHVYTWRALTEIGLSDEVVHAKKFNYDHHQSPSQWSPSQSSSASAPSRLPFPIGTQVMVVGLNAKPQYNGQMGTLTLWNAQKARVGVKLDSGDGGDGLLLKPENVVLPHNYADAAARNELIEANRAMSTQLTEPETTLGVPPPPPLSAGLANELRRAAEECELRNT